MANKTFYPPVGFHFKVDFEGTDGSFQEVSGLSAEVTIEELTAGGENTFIHKLPTRTKYGNLILKRGFIKDSDLMGWLTDAIENFIFKPRVVNVNLLNEKHEVIAQWTFSGAYPVKWVVSDFKAMENGLVIETIELAYQTFKHNKI
jgi:phage tail-like protein